MTVNPGDGIYESKSNWFAQKKWPVDRRVYIQGTTVRLVSYKAYGDTGFSSDLFNFNHFFDVNTLGPRIGDLPENFNIYTRD